MFLWACSSVVVLCHLWGDWYSPFVSAGSKWWRPIWALLHFRAHSYWCWVWPSCGQSPTKDVHNVGSIWFCAAPLSIFSPAVWSTSTLIKWYAALQDLLMPNICWFLGLSAPSHMRFHVGGSQRGCNCGTGMENGCWICSRRWLFQSTLIARANWFYCKFWSASSWSSSSKVRRKSTKQWHTTFYLLFILPPFLVWWLKIFCVGIQELLSSKGAGISSIGWGYPNCLWQLQEGSKVNQMEARQGCPVVLDWSTGQWSLEVNVCSKTTASMGFADSTKMALCTMIVVCSGWLGMQTEKQCYGSMFAYNHFCLSLMMSSVTYLSITGEKFLLSCQG